jgi:hypothetical protein
MHNNSDEVFGKHLRVYRARVGLSKNSRIEQLRDKAVKQCIDINGGFTGDEVKGLPPSVQEAWNIGKAFVEL